MKNKEVGDVDANKVSIIGKSYYIMAISPPISAPRGKIESDGGWKKRSCGRVWRGPFRPTIDRSR